MVHLPLDAPLTRREFHMELMVVWLFVWLASAAALSDSQRWSAAILPAGALLMVALHARARRRKAQG